MRVEEFSFIIVSARILYTKNESIKSTWCTEHESVDVVNEDVRACTSNHKHTTYML